MKCLLTLVVLCMLVSCNEKAVPVDPGVSWQLAQYRAALLSDLDYRLDMVIGEQGPIKAKIDITFQLRDNAAPLQLDFRQRAEAVLAVVVNGDTVDYEFVREHIVLPASALRAGRNAVTIDFIAGESSLNRRPDFLYTLFVPDRARTAFPLFDQPDLKATFKLGLTLPPEWIALSNAPVASVEHSDAGARYQFARSDRISSYLFSFVAGKFQTETRVRNGRTLTMLHRETDSARLARNIERVFDLHAAAIAWMKQYTGIKYPFQKFDFVLIPGFQYGGMEHVGAVQYRADSILLDPAPSDEQRLSRASLIAHETAHMWFGDLVTMRWFDDVWTKEVFANFMAAKIINPDFPDIDHPLHFLIDHYPAAYAVDRSAGANAIRQPLANLNEAGQLYGGIIYHKAPVMMRQLEALIGAETLRDGLREYLHRYAWGNATWPELIAILDARTDVDLHAWSEVWVNSPGRPEFELQRPPGRQAVLRENDPAGMSRVWPQRFSVRVSAPPAQRLLPITVTGSETAVPELADDASAVLFNADGMGYGLFPADPRNLQLLRQLPPLERGAVLVNDYEQVLAGARDARQYYQSLLTVLDSEDNQLLLALALRQVARLHQSFLSAPLRRQLQDTLETTLWRGVQNHSDKGVVKLFFDAFVSLAESGEQVDRLSRIWSGELTVDRLELAENDKIRLAEVLALRLPAQYSDIIDRQLQRTSNPDNRKRLAFVAPALAPDLATRDAFFASLADEHNRETERWVLEALAYLHHPSRIAQSVKYIRPSLDLLQQIQVTGDIFFPVRWVGRTLENHHSSEALQAVDVFLAEHPHYNEQLRMKILQAADLPRRANAVLAAEAAAASGASRP